MSESLEHRALQPLNRDAAPDGIRIVTIEPASSDTTINTNRPPHLNRTLDLVAFTPFREELKDWINKVHYTNKPLGIKRNGKLVAVLIPVEMYKILEK